ncbi:MAG: sulfotransferase [Pseudomonadales bacterium]|nr:sulfotransferase [Pseudomonadales bacterium]
MKKLYDKIKKAIEPEWPIQNTTIDFEPNFIFLLTPSNSGSTAISQVFVNSPNVGQMHPRAEGQWLIKGMHNGDSWNNEKYIKKNSLRSVWLNKCHQVFKEHNARYFIEKSPPNMMRVDLLQKVFPNHILLANNRNPYANVSSRFYRYTKNREGLSLDQRLNTMRGLAKTWALRSKILKDLIQNKKIPYLSYEDFCSTPSLLQAQIDKTKFSGQVKLNFSASVKVKDYQAQGIVDYNQKQIDGLTPNDLSAISGVLKNNENLLSFFDYEIHD